MKLTVSISSATTKAGIVKFKVADQMIQKAKAIGGLLALEIWSVITNHWRVNGTLISPYNQNPNSTQAASLPEHMSRQPLAIQGFYRAFQAVNQSDVDTLLHAISRRRLLADLYKHYRNATLTLSSSLQLTDSGRLGVTAAT